MKIDCIRTYHLRHVLSVPFGFSQMMVPARNVLLVEIIADDGTTGWGECYGPPEVYQAAIRCYYGPRLRGCDPRQIDILWHAMWRTTLDFARRGVMMGAMSGLDMALWDLKGKALARPVWELMGGRCAEKLSCYATGMYFRDLPEVALIDALIAEATDYRDQGFAGVKVKIGKTLAFDMELLRRVRDALPDMRLFSDANHAYDLPEAIQIGQLLDKLGYGWFEEPLSPEHPGMYRQLQERLGLPLAAGECEQTRWGFQSLLTGGGVQIAQPDLAYCGGPSEALKVRNIASSLGINVTPHVWGTMLNLAAAVHFHASGYREPGRADAAPLMLECDRSPNALRDELFEIPIHVEGGVAHVPTDPGLGVTVDPAAMNSFLVHGDEIR
jgi:D-galactarolactone cycloisomerase